MKIGVFGTGMVGSAIAGKLVELGHDVKMGSRAAGNDKAVAWAKAAGARGSQGSFADAASFGEMLFNCTGGSVSLAVLQSAAPADLAGKVLVDLSNPLAHSKGSPPTLTVCNTDSIGEQIQRAFPDTKVVKTLNTVNAHLMVNAALVKGDHDLFMCGNDAAAKAMVTELVTGGFGWKNIVDLGDITAARGMEMYVLFWIRLYGAAGSPMFNIHLAR
jgi:predicted dinucleotide-binding enzyme